MVETAQCMKEKSPT